MQEVNTAKTNEQFQPFLTIPKVAKLLGVSRPTVYTLIDTEGLPAMKLGKSVRIDPVALKQWLDTKQKKAICHKGELTWR
jgi:excisionase family DNA binding protein